jgi:thiamine pyrophosphokinase
MRCLISLNGVCDVDLREYDADILVGVDGGTVHLLNAGLKPHMIVGDFDSFKGNVSGAEVVRFPEDKDEIDAELALRECFKKEVDEILVACWRGERADMEFALYNLLTNFPPLSVKLVSEKLVTFYLKGSKKLEAKKGEKWSIIPIGGDAVVTLKGFKYEIKEKIMPLGKPYGVSNIAKSDKVLVETKRGGVLIFRWMRKPL